MWIVTVCFFLQRETDDDDDTDRQTPCESEEEVCSTDGEMMVRILDHWQ